MRKKIVSVVGARPNFIKIAALHKAFSEMTGIVSHKICHTGQHFDKKMSDVFFTELELPKPDYFLGVSGGSHAQQTAQIILEFEKVLLLEKPDLVIVVGDVNSTMACALVASKLNIPLAHIEAGLRSFDREMPEETNRKVTDVLSDYLFVTEQSGVDNLLKEGVDEQKIFFVGNVMIDSLYNYLPQAKCSPICKELSIKPKDYILVTFHRPSNVDDFESLVQLQSFLNKLSELKTVVFPIHPRTRSNFEKHSLMTGLNTNIRLTDPIGYIDFIALQLHALLVITDSGGIQEETTALQVQCLTVRNNTERPVTVEIGTNQLIGTNYDLVIEEAIKRIKGQLKKGSLPYLWDGKSASRIARIIINKLVS
jgi:UDP-N-acetylglucosamine 2-epimerase (non-hydrolysing)